MCIRDSFIAVSYNKTFSAVNAQSSYELDVVQDEWTLTTGKGITSSLALMGASEALAYVDEGSIESLNLIDSDKIETGYYLESNGKKTETSSTSWWVTDYVKVTPGDEMCIRDRYKFAGRTPEEMIDTFTKIMDE